VAVFLHRPVLLATYVSRICFVDGVRLVDRRTLWSLRNHDIAELEDARAIAHARNPRFTRRDYLVHANWSDLIEPSKMHGFWSTLSAMWVKNDGDCGLKDVRKYAFCMPMVTCIIAAPKSHFGRLDIISKR
jgi:hypothetical protein